MSAALALPLRWMRAMPRPSPAAAYVLRVLAAIALAIYAAYALQLDSPYSAGTTVIVLMNASRGAILSKSVWRVLGTLTGAVAAIVIVAVFVQTPVMFILAAAAWLGVCTFIGSLLRYNRSYGAVLAGYTVTLIAFGAIAQPERIFDIAMARIAVVVTGVLATALVFLVTDLGPGRASLERSLASFATRVAALLAEVSRTGALAPAMAPRHALAMELGAFDQVVEFAAAEDAGLARYKDDLRVAIAELFAALIGGLHAAALMRGLPEGRARAAFDAALARAAGFAPGVRAAAMRETLRDAIEIMRAEAPERHAGPALAALAQGVALLTQFDLAFGGLAALQDGVRLDVPYRVRFYINPVTALRNGVRAAVAVTLAGLFWIVSRWSDGGVMLALMGPICALISQTDSAARSSVHFMWGAMLGCAAGLVCSYVLLPQMSGFLLLMAAMAPFIVAGVLVSRSPQYGMVGLAYLVTFMTVAAPTNPMHFALADSINAAIAFSLAGVFAALSFRVLLPPNPVAEGRVLAHSIRNAVERLASSRHVPRMLVWEHLQHQKIVRLSGRLARFPEERARTVTAAAAAIIVGRHLIALKTLGAELPADARAAAARVLTAFRRLVADPQAAASAARAEAVALAGADRPLDVLRLAGNLDDLGSLVSAHRDFFARRAA